MPSMAFSVPSTSISTPAKLTQPSPASSPGVLAGARYDCAPGVSTLIRPPLSAAAVQDQRLLNVELVVVQHALVVQRGEPVELVEAARHGYPGRTGVRRG